MFVILGDKWKYNKKKNGLRINKHCPNCQKFATFQEVIPTQYFALFFIPVFPTQKEKSLLECPLCKSRYNIQTQDYHASIGQLKTK